MKKKTLNKFVKTLPVLVVVLSYFVLSLACVTTGPVVISDQPVAEKSYVVNTEVVKDWLVSHKEKVTVANGLTSEQLMEVTKLCLSSGELQGVSIINENKVLSFAVLDAQVMINREVLRVKFNYSISRSGILTMKIVDIYEDVPGTYSVNVRASRLEGYKSAVMNQFIKRLRGIADTVIKRSEDFA